MGFIIINSIFRSGFQFLLDELLVFSNIYIIYIQIINGYGCTINKEINNSEINLQRLHRRLRCTRLLQHRSNPTVQSLFPSKVMESSPFNVMNIAHPYHLFYFVISIE